MSKTGALKWVILWSLWAARWVRQPTRPVRVSNGWLQGVVPNEGTHVQYLGVPYATVEKRFQAPGPEPSWEGVRVFNDEHIRCTQRFTSSFISGQEDCQTLNIYTPIQQSPKLRPVMVFIHGGGFRDGSGSPFLYGPQYLIRHDIILVSFNYRLEVLGFLCLRTKEAPGNAGLKDQVAALKWVKRNIKQFGGDPDNVTIFGESAGSASVMYHLISPMSRGLFQKAILQSGSAMSPWSFQFEPLKTASLLSKHMGYDLEDQKDIYDIFTKKTAVELLKTRVPRKVGDIVLSENIFVPCVEKNLPGEEAFLLNYPYDLVSKGLYTKVPLIMGHNNAEGLMFVGKENDTTISKVDFYKAMPRDLNFPTEKEKIDTALRFKKLYMGNEEITKENLEKLAHFEGDSGITFPVISAIDLFAKTSTEPIYAYKFCYDGWMNFAKRAYGFVNAPGATHADELFYIFKNKIPVLLHEYIERDIIRNVTTMWTNFAKHGQPVPPRTPWLPVWQPINKENPQLLVINKKYSTAPIWNSEPIRFWNATYTKYRKKV